MKRILALLLVLAMLLVLTACGGGKEDTPKGENSKATANDSVSDTQNGTQNTDEDTMTPDATENPSSSDSVENHTHDYTSEVTTAATCTTDGVKTFTCSCGDTYTEPIVTTGHAWGAWEVTAKALVGKTGKEKRTCTACSLFEEKESTANAIANSFYDSGLQYIVASHYGKIDKSTVLSYFSHNFSEFWNKPVPSATVISMLSERFNVTDQMKADIIQFGKEMPFHGYNEAADTFTFKDNGDVGEFVLLGYVHNNGNRYTAYYNFTPNGIDATVPFAIELEYNLLNGKPNKYLSAQRANELPAGMIKCTEG